MALSLRVLDSGIDIQTECDMGPAILQLQVLIISKASSHSKKKLLLESVKRDLLIKVMQHHLYTR